ncbi:SDR family NAD(P)-dependent oxidoreductase [Fundicoccus sp. Sow4_H7]|uniref:SDR family NAD(P)-dependent oxidoreductase n=1 Tax=Fundicoccus sp. Sow4_H7 TaxID=3438784 RepID=UPI003F8FAA23
MGRLKDKIALVTGGSQSLGGEMCKRFKEEGATVVSLDLITPTGFEADFFELNVTDAEKEFTRKGAQIRTNCIAPGYINTSILDTVPEKIIQSMKDSNPMKRLGEPIEIANAALFLASDEASYINGHVLAVNGGMRI